MMIRGNSILLLTAFFFIMITSCDIINPEEKIPAFVYFKPFEISTDFEEEGTTDQQLPFAEILAGDLNLGIHGLPARVPILLEGQHQLDIFPGIEENGISSFPNVYSFLNFESVNVNLVPGQVDTVELKTTYRDNLEFPILEPFESALQIFRNDLDGDPSTSLSLTNSDVFEGNSSARATLTKDHPELTVATDSYQVLPPDGSLVYLEMNYKTDVQFSVGVLWRTAQSGQQSNFTNFINVKDNWNKIYLNFSEVFDVIHNLPEFLDWQIAISARVPVENGEFVDGTYQTWVDNIKLIHFEP